LQYSYARASSILKKAKYKPKKVIIYNLNEHEIKLVKKLEVFPNVVNQSYEKLNPSLIANYSFELSQLFNEFYHACPVLDADKKDKEERLALVEAFKIVIKSSLILLGIEVMDEM
jgi:arginyl-tRNA synthetase